MTTRERRSVFLEDAQKGALKLCGMGTCACAFPCGRKKNEQIGLIPRVTETKLCPLDKYRVKPETNSIPWYKRSLEEMQPTESELFALCACCKNTSVAPSEDGEFWELEVKDADKCLDCPVKVELDSIKETAAEAAMS